LNLLKKITLFAINPATNPVTIAMLHTEEQKYTLAVKFKCTCHQSHANRIVIAKKERDLSWMASQSALI
jgi:hypothetical protein